MDNLNLNIDEEIIQKTQTIIINGVRHEAVLTGRRLILVESETSHVHEDIPYTDIDRVISGVNKLREPVITITFNSPEGEKRTQELIFIRLPGNLNIKDIEKAIAILKDHNVPVEGKVPLVESVRLDRGDKADTAVLAVDEKASRPAVPDWSVMGTAQQIRQPPKDESPERSPLFSIAAIILIVIVIIVGAMALGQLLNTKNVPIPQQMAEPDIPDETMPYPSLVQEPLPKVIPEVDSPAPPITVPSSGVWMRVSCPGNYSGYIGAQGWNIAINSSGTRFYQLPFENVMIEGSIEKQDGTADTLEVGIYNGGTLVSKSETAKPYGMVEIRVAIGPSSGGAVIPIPTQEIQISPYASLPEVSVPPSGVWVRIFYPGDFIGSIRANGQLRNVNSTGDQFYQLPITGGIIEGSVEKQDGSVENLIIEVYKDGALLNHWYTSTPRGMVGIHTNV